MISCKAVTRRKSRVCFGWRMICPPDRKSWTKQAQRATFQIRKNPLLPQALHFPWNLTAEFGILKMLICWMSDKCLCFAPSLLHPPETPLTHLGPLIWGFAFRSGTEPRPGASSKCWCSDARECLCCPCSPHLEPPFLLWSLVSGKSHKADLWIETLSGQITMLLLPSVLWNSILCPRLI